MVLVISLFSSEIELELAIVIELYETTNLIILLFDTSKNFKDFPAFGWLCLNC